MGTSLSFLIPLQYSFELPNKILRNTYVTLLSLMTTSSVLVHSGVDSLLWVDKGLIYTWVAVNSFVLSKIRDANERSQAAVFGAVVLLLGITRWYQRHVGLHALMHVSGALGTLQLIKSSMKCP